MFIQLKNLRKNGFTIVFISHKLNEVKEICDRITVLRDGRVVGAADVADVTEQDISKMMVGRDISMDMEKKPAERGEKILCVNHLGFTNMYGKKR